MNNKNLKGINKIWSAITILLIILSIILAVNLYNKNVSYATVVENDSNQSLYEIVDRVQNTKIYLAKALISKDATHGLKTL